MFIRYEEHELTDLFKSDPIDIYEKEVGMFIYSFSDIHGIKVTINVSIYEKEVILLISKNEEVAFESKLKNVESLCVEDNCLRIHQSGVVQDIVIQLTPNILMRYVEVSEN